MPPPTSRKKPGSQVRIKTDAKSLKRKRVVDEHESLNSRVQDLDIKATEINDFTDLPLSQPTINGLSASHFKNLTDIQSKAIPFALKGRDILGAAKTGSGKTLAFLVPVLENLYRQKWTESDGLGALIISPTRELAIQIFEVLRKVGRMHTFSAGLIVGGKDLKDEKERMSRMNILVCTPGRMLQHLDQTDFKVHDLQMLVLDEADRCLDMGFQRDIDAIIDHLPKERQTMLFSATQTKKISDLARLSLKDPEYVAVHEAATSATPSTLKQHYVITSLPEKLNTLFSFIRTNLKSKIMVFLSSGKQVRFVYESFRHLQPGIPLLHLHGRQKQTARLDITTKFARAKHSCLFATDVVARGLDFPAVDWVIQLDCPEDADTYIHRVGRTARYESEGRAVLFIDPSEEEGMLKRLEQKKVPILKATPRQNKQQSITKQLQNMCFQDPELKYLGQKAFTSYTKSVNVQKDREIFDLKRLDLDGYAASMGLPGTPKIKFRKGDDAKQLKNAPRAALSSDDEDTDGENKTVKKKEEVKTKYDRMFSRTNQDVLSGHYSSMIQKDVESEEDDFLAVKKVHGVNDESSDDEAEAEAGPMIKSIPGISKEIVIDSKRREKLLKSKKALLKLKDRGTKLIYDSDGEAHEVYELEDEEGFNKKGTASEQRAKFVEQEVARVSLADVDDKATAKAKKREKIEKRKRRDAAADSDDDTAPGLVDTSEDYDPMALLASLPIAGEDEDEEESNADEDTSRPPKRPRKWFEGEDDEDEKKNVKSSKRILDAPDEPDTLEDLEALAAGLLG